MLKIFVDAHCFDGGFQGIRTFLKGLYAARPLPDDITIYLGARNIENLKQEFPGIPEGNFIRYKSRHAFFRLGFEIPYLLRKYGFDYAHFQYISPILSYCKYIVTTHDILFKDFRNEFPFNYRLIRSFLFRISLKNAHIKTTPSRYCWERIINIYKIHPEELHVIPNGIDETFFPASQDRSHAMDVIDKKYRVRNYILYVSRIEPRKNHELLLQSYLELELYKEGISLVLIGACALKSRTFLKRVTTLSRDIKPFVCHYPDISQEDLRYFYRAARLLVYPSKAEGFGIPPLEAAALRTPVLCANTTAMSAFSFFKDNLFDPADKPGLKHRLTRLLASPPDEEELRTISRLIQDRYSWEKAGLLLWGCLRDHERSLMEIG